MLKSHSYKIALFTGGLVLVGAVSYLVVAILLPLAVMYTFIASVALFFVAIGFFAYSFPGSGPSEAVKLGNLDVSNHLKAGISTSEI